MGHATVPNGFTSTKHSMQKANPGKARMAHETLIFWDAFNQSDAPVRASLTLSHEAWVPTEGFLYVRAQRWTLRGRQHAMLLYSELVPM